MPVTYFPTNLVYPFTLRVTGIKIQIRRTYAVGVPLPQGAICLLGLIDGLRCSGKDGDGVTADFSF